MNVAGNEILRQANAPDAQLLRQRQEAINKRWKALCTEVFDRQKYSGRPEEGSVKTSEFTDDMDELFFWIDETENILGSTLKLDTQYLSELLEKVKDREDEVPSRQQSLNAINANGGRMLHQDSMSAEDRENIQRDLENLNHRWTKVVSEIPEYVDKVTQRLQQLRALQGEANEVQGWLETTRELLETQVSPPGSLTSPDENDSVVVDPQTTQFAIQTRGVNVKRINATYRKLSEGSEEQEVDVPAKLTEQVDAINRDWAEVQRLADHLQPHEDSEVNEVMAQVKAEVNQSSPPATATSPLATSPTTTSPWPDFDKSVHELREWLTLLEDLLISQRVTVCDVKEIEQILASQKSLLQDMESRRPQLDEVLTTADKLQQDASNDNDRRAVREQVTSLRQHWDAALGRAERRKTQLDDMLLECRQFHQNYADLERWLAQVEDELDARPIRPESPQQVDTLIKQHQALQEEVDSHQAVVDGLRKMAEKLIEEYSEDDTRNARTQLERLSNRWSRLLNRQVENIDGCVGGLLAVEVDASTGATLRAYDASSAPERAVDRHAYHPVPRDFKLVYQGSAYRDS
ncbi:hypothetical protein BaRGS_00025453, partial [Batillaria attramentaria]